MREIFRSTILARVWRPLPLGFTLGWLIVGGLLGGRFRTFDPVIAMYVLVTFMGLVSLDVENGGLHLILARRITRNQYLAGRLSAALSIGFVFCLLWVAVAWGTAVTWAHSGRLLTSEDLIALLVQSLGEAGWQIAILFFFSTFLPGRIDAFAYWLLLVANELLNGLGMALDKAWLMTLTEWIADQLQNPLGSWALGAAVWTDLLRFSSNLTLVILAGVLIFHRRQFSCAAG